jgi:hypothetical protein
MIKHELLFREDPSVASERVNDASSENKTPADVVEKLVRMRNCGLEPDVVH